MMMQPNGIGPESFDLLKEYLQSNNLQSSELQRLLASISTNDGNVEDLKD